MLRERSRDRSSCYEDLSPSRLPLDARRPSPPALSRLETGIRLPAPALGHLQRRHDPLHPRDCVSHASDFTRFVVRAVARSLPLRRQCLLHHDRRAAVHASVLSRVDRLPQPARKSWRPHRLLSKLRRRHARASDLLHKPRPRVSRLWTKRLGHHCFRQRQRLPRLGWPTTRSGHRRNDRPFRGGRLIDVHP